LLSPPNHYQRLTNLASQASLCYALLGSIASAALLSESGDATAATVHNARTAALSPRGDAGDAGDARAAGAAVVPVGVPLYGAIGGGAALIGRRVLVEFITEDGATTAYTGHVRTFGHGSGAHTIEWDDGVFEPTEIDLHNGVRFSMGRAAAGNQFGHAAGCPLNITFLDDPDPRRDREAGDLEPHRRGVISFPKACLLSTYLGHDWPQRYGPPLFAVSIYSNIQGLLASSE